MTSGLISLEFWENHRYHIWIIGFVLRILVTPFDPLEIDYPNYRIPIALGLANGKGLYNEIHYNQMPLYPYLSAIMILMVGTENDLIMAMAIKFPQALADAIIPYFLYEISRDINYKKAGLISSLIYSVNPISLFEISNATFHPIASLFSIVSIYLLIREKSFLVGVTISLGFLVSQYPLIIFGVVIVLWKNEPDKIVNSILGFITITTIILGFVLIPFDTSLRQMFDDLSKHPVYTETGYQNTSRDLYTLFNHFLDIPFSIYFQIWSVIFGILLLFPLILLYRNPRQERIIDVLTMQMTLLSIFFISNHTKHTLWLFPWVLIWGFRKDGKNIILPFLIFLGYFLRRMQGALPGKYLIGDSVLGITGALIMYIIINDLLTKPVTINSSL